MKSYRTIVPNSFKYSSYSALVFNRNVKEAVFDTVGFDISNHFYQILYSLFGNREKSICIIVPNPNIKKIVFRILSEYKCTLPKILTHLQWDVVEGAPKFDFIIATGKDSFNTREINLLKAKSKKKLIFINWT